MQKIINFWNSIEKFTPCQIETDNEKKPYRVENIQREVLGNYDLPWLNKGRFKHLETIDKRWSYEVFLGIIEINDITKVIKELLENDAADYDLKSTEAVSCIASFQVNSDGCLVDNSLVIPDYFLSMGALSLMETYPGDWLERREGIRNNLNDIFSNLSDELHSLEGKKPLEYVNLEHLLNSFIKCAELEGFLGPIITKNSVRNSAVIYSKNLLKSKSGNEDSSIINSFFIDDLTKISNLSDKIFIRKEEANSDLLPNKSLKQYLRFEERTEELDSRKDRELVKKFTNFRFLPQARWPGKGDFSLVLSQQLAVNLALREEEGLFSVNGPPGTGKTTLLRDIISGVILKRAKVLSALKHPDDAFINPLNFQIDHYNYKAWQLKPELLGHEIFITSSNNNAVENISKEIPLRSQIDESHDLDYFSQISSFISGQESWGLGSAALGNSKNRSEFFNKFWDKKPKKDPKTAFDKAFGLEYLLNEIRPEKSWDESKEGFLKSLANYEKIENELCELETIIKEVAALKKKIKELKGKISLLREDVANKENNVTQIDELKIVLEKRLNSKKDTLKYHKEAKPSAIEIIIELFSGLKNYKKWREKYNDLLKEFYVLDQENSKHSQKISEVNGEISQIKKDLLEFETSSSCSENSLREKSILFDKYKILMGEDFPDEGFWELPDEELQLRLPWNFKKMHALRSEIFIKALNLHKAFIINAGSPRIGKNGKLKMGPLMNNLRVMKRKISQGLPKKYDHIVPHLWASFFCVVPTVSTTFASFGNLCQGLESGSIGYLLIDEAGQAVVQAAAGAIYRSKRVIVVGDPMQIKPVITTPKAIVDVLKDYYGLEDDLFNSLEQSVQTLSDRANIFGTFIGDDENRKWVGCPLRVHRRCNDPMFKIANKIAYDNLMISSTNNKVSDIEKLFSESLWFDVESNQASGNWIEEEGELVIDILSRIMVNNHDLPSLYIISPFKTVATNMKKLLFKEVNSLFGRNVKKAEISSWIHKSVGTIHTFQGKETEVVILLLGGNPQKPGSLNWAAKEPNILNVGLTRAKNLIFVVGNHKSWSKRKYFQDLSFEITRVDG